MEFYKVGRPLGINTSSLQVLQTGGDRVTAGLMENLTSVLPDTYVMQVYAQTESSGLLTVFDINDPEDVELLHRKPESCGRPLSSVDEYKVRKALK